MSALHIIQDLLSHVLEQNNDNVGRVLALVDDDPRIVTTIAAGVALATLRQTVHAIAVRTPSLQPYPEAVQIAIVASLLARTVNQHDYDTIDRIPPKELGRISSEIISILNSVRSIKV